jgi:predicted GH43/DUF377 family glycosyl hydrolase
MDFKLHQLSGSNLTSIFNNAYIEAETVKDTEFCAINGERNMLLIAYSEHNILQYQNWVYFSKDFTEEDANRFAKEINKKMIMLKAYVSNTEDGEICIAIKYNHVILEHESISGKTLVKLTRMVERHLLFTNQIYDEMFLKR